VNPSAVAAHRLVLASAEWALLCQRAGIVPPHGFEAGDEVNDQALVTATRSLARRGVLTRLAASDDEVGPRQQISPSVAANLAVLVAPHVLVQVEVSLRQQGLRAVYAIRRPLGTSVFTLAERAVELSMFPAVHMGHELVRAVPPAPQETAIKIRIEEAFATAAHGPPLRGRVPLALLAEYGPTGRMATPGTAAAKFFITKQESELAAEVTARTIGVLRCVVTGPGDDVPNTDTATVLVGQVVWLATDAGWVGLRQAPDGSGRQIVELVPVAHDEIGSWLAPYVAQILEVADDRP
jgi:hypothetical protein